MSQSHTDTICARATAPGQGAIAIIRLSGPEAISLVNGCFRPMNPNQNIGGAKSHSLIFGCLFDPTHSEPIDDALVSVMRGPHSYTGEDVVEINCHGSNAIIARTLRLFVERGARVAEPGEFTRRAFENGQIDLAQAEAVCDLISAKTTGAARIALRQLEGIFSGRLATIRERSLDLLAEIEAHIDFPEEDLPTVMVERWGETIGNLAGELERLIRGGERGHLMREGVRVVLAGKPNAGKSSLFNSILGHERAIVTSEPGTTRDTIESISEIEGFPVIWVDTAGLRAAQGQIERIGVERTQRELKAAALVVLCIPIDEPWDDESEQAFDTVVETDPIVIFTKCDLPAKADTAEIEAHLGSGPLIRTSATGQLGLNELIGTITSRLRSSEMSDEDFDPLVSSIRHIETLRLALSEMQAASPLLESCAPQTELVAASLRAAVHQLDQILGLEIGEDVLDRIFSRFCIGK